MSAIQNLQPFNLSADASKADDWLSAGTQNFIRIRTHQRDGWKILTIVEEIDDEM